MNVLRTQTSQGVVISFDRGDVNIVREKNPPLKTSRELIQTMSHSRLLVKNPIDRTIERMWVLGGQKLYDQPDKKAIAHSDD